MKDLKFLPLPRDAQATSDFGSYLKESKKTPFVLDLSKASLLEVIDEHIIVRQRVSPKYGKSLSCLKRHLIIIQERYSCTLMPSQVTDIFWSHFTRYLLDAGLLMSSVKTLFSQLRATLTWAARHKAEVAPSYDIFTLPVFQNQQIALTLDDVSRIYHFDLSTIKKRPQYLRHLEVVRDMFVLSCNLGQRFSDMIRVDEFCFDHGTFSIIQQKTGTRAIVDIDRYCMDKKMVYQILEKYNYKSPLTTDISAYNKYLKYLMKAVGFTEMIRRDTRVNGTIKSEYIPKYKLIGSHTARRTFVTVNLIRGIPIHELMRASGHTSYSSFQKYWCI